MGQAKSQAPDNSLLVSCREARALLGIGAGTLDNLLKAGDLPCVRFGRSLRIRRADLQDLVDRNAAPWGEAP
jgi:excisionase family DNA binding protein